MEQIIGDANPNLPLLKPESGDNSLLRNLIEIIVTNSFKEIYQKALELYLKAKLVIFEKEFQELKKGQKQKTDIWPIQKLLYNVATFLASFKTQVSKNCEIALRYADIYYEIWLLIIELIHSKIKSKSPEIQTSCDVFKSHLEYIQGNKIQENKEIINETENSTTQTLTRTINFINEHLTSLYQLFDNWDVREAFLDLLEFLKNPNRDRLKQKLQEITDLLNEISRLLNEILKIINEIIKEKIKKLNAQITELENIEEEEIQKLKEAQTAKLKNIEEEIQKLNTQITELKNMIVVTISDISDESSAAYIAAYTGVTPAYTGATQKLPDLPEGASKNGLKERLSRLFSLGKK